MLDGRLALPKTFWWDFELVYWEFGQDDYAAIEHANPSVLHAYDPTNVDTELYNSNQAANSRDHFGKASHFGVPTISNGKVYVGTTNSVVAFGLLGGK